ncbi:MAG: phosphate ABC transporter substrate-binding protein [Anaerolineae bacterium]|nr:phosphate ABC transporter substrate-binding protein [Anaerolineae bacterium]
MRSSLRFLCLWLLLMLSGCANSASADPSTPPPSDTHYITVKGSDTMVNLALAWAEQYQEIHPEVRLSVTGGGTGTGIAALINGSVDLANASRAIKPEEFEQAKQAGFMPVEFTVARDAIAIIVNPANPVSQLTLEQISQIYRGNIKNWKELGGEDRPIVSLSRETNSGTHVYFLETVVRLNNKKDKSIFSPTTLLLPSSEGIIAEVRDNPNAIGYDGLGYVTPEVKVIAVARDAESPYILPSVETVNEGIYPISRDLYIYTRGKPSGIKQDYLNWIKSAEAQKIVSQLGFVPIKPMP